MKRMVLALLLWYCGYRWMLVADTERKVVDIHVGERCLYKGRRTRIGSMSEYYVSTHNHWWSIYTEAEHKDLQPIKRICIHKDNIAGARLGQIRLRRTPEWNYIN